MNNSNEHKTLEDLFKDAEKRAEKLSVSKVGKGADFFTKIVPSLEKVSKVILGAAAVATIAGSLFTIYNKVEHIQFSSTDKVVSVNTEVNDQSKVDAKNALNGVYEHENGYKTQKVVSPLKGIKAVDNGDKYRVNINSAFVNNGNFHHLKSIADFEIDKNMKNQQIANSISKFSFRNGNYYEALMVQGEGYTKTAADNIGSTIYHGINLNFQSKTTMENLAKGISTDENRIKAYATVAGMSDRDMIRKILSEHWVEPQQSLQMAVMLQERYDDDMIDQIHKVAGKGLSKTEVRNNFNTLEPNVAAAIRYMPFKTGGANFGKYKTLINQLVEYSKLPKEERTQEMRDKMAETVKFSYVVEKEIEVINENGVKEIKKVKERVVDERATLLVQSMLRNPQAFAYLIGEDLMPENFEKFYKSAINTDGKSVKFDKEEFNNHLPSLEDKLAEMQKDGAKVTVDYKLGAFGDDELSNVEREINKFNNSGVKKNNEFIKRCTSGTSSWSVSAAPKNC